MKKKFSLNPLGLVLALTLLLSACGPQATPAPTTDINAIYTQAAATIAVSIAQTAQAIPTATLVPPTATSAPTATFAPLPTLAPTQAIVYLPTSTGPTAVPVDTATANGCYNAALLADVTVPGGTKFDVGDAFTKTWRVKNTGTCDWNGEFKIAFVGGNVFGSDTTKIRKNVAAGGITEISLAMIAPDQSGAVNSNWQMLSDDGKYFGPVMTVAIILPGTTASATPDNSGCYQAALVSSSTPDGTKYTSGDTFTQTWVIKNAGTCNWDSNFKIKFVGGDVFGADTTKIRQKVAPGATAAISLDMIAPSGSGEVTSSWQMATGDGDVFGPIYTLKIVLK
jgi:hypothetical protein